MGTIQDIADGCELPVLLEITGTGSFSDSTDLLMTIRSFSLGEPVRRHKNKIAETLEIKISGENIPDGAHKFTSTVMKYVFDLLDRYAEDGLEVIDTSLMLFGYLPADHREGRVESMKKFIESDGTCLYAGNKVVPRFTSNILNPLLLEYMKKFDKFESVRIKPGDGRYEDLQQQLGGDIDTFQRYAFRKFEENTKCNPNAENISFDECFPHKKSDRVEYDYTDLTGDNIKGYALRGGNGVQSFVEKYGVPCDIKVGGNRGVNNSVELWFPNCQKPVRVSVTYAGGGINSFPKDRAFFAGLVDLINPTSDSAIHAGKARHFLSHR